MGENEMKEALSCAASVMKLVCGCGNNAAWMACLEAHDRIKHHPHYKGKVKHYYRQALEIFRAYEMRLVHGDTFRMFHVADMPPAVRKKYGAITDKDYYDFWTDIGATAYHRTRPIITSLQNKYRLSLKGHGVMHADLLAWVMTAQACLQMSLTMYEAALQDCAKGYRLRRKVLELVFGQFSLHKVAKAWMRALTATDPSTDGYKLDALEERNIEMGLEQLHDAWINTDTLYGSVMTATGEYDEIFRTRGEQKKALREIADIRSATEAELNK